MSNLLRFLGGDHHNRTTWLDLLPATASLPVYEDSPCGKMSRVRHMAVYSHDGEEGAEGEKIYRFQHNEEPADESELDAETDQP